VISPSEEEVLKKALNLIEEKANHFKTQYGVKDELYLQSMITLNLAVDLIKSKLDYQHHQANLGEKILQIFQLLNQSLQNIASSYPRG
ncbi:MAG: cell division protein ZapA, partial [Bacteroidia bacterium]|nr:cell division protein ZapA [Bacteroidia bacterium]